MGHGPIIVLDGSMYKVHDVHSVSADHLLKFSLLSRPRVGGYISPESYQCLNFILLFLVVLEI